MYYLLFGIFYVVSLLPLRVLYGFSYLASWIVFDIIKYRKNVIQSNLEFAFPEKSDTEILKIRKDFERAFCDQWIEVIKMMSIRRESLNRMINADWSFFEKYNLEKKNVHVFLGHQFNWELANLACQYNTFQQFYGIYLPLSSRAFDRLMLYIRKRTNSHLVNAQHLLNELRNLKKEHHILGVIADQSSNNVGSCYWYEFLHRPCPFTFGPEKTAKLFDAVVVFASTQRISRGKYKISFTQITENASKVKMGELMDKYVFLLEKSIKEQPHNWLWSHNRWKRKLPENETVRIVVTY